MTTILKAVEKAVKSGATYVTQTGITFTVMTDGILMGGASPLSKRIAQRVRSGALLITTPHRAGGAYRERGAGGVYAEMPAKAKYRSLAVWLTNDPRFDQATGAELLAGVAVAYTTIQ